MASRKLYFEAVRVGEELPPLAKPPVDRVQLSRYAGASGDFNPVHVDETYAKGMGMPSVYAPGMLIMGFLGQLDLRLGARRAAPALLGEVLEDRLAGRHRGLQGPGDRALGRGGPLLRRARRVGGEPEGRAGAPGRSADPALPLPRGREPPAHRAAAAGGAVAAGEHPPAAVVALASQGIRGPAVGGEEGGLRASRRPSARPGTPGARASASGIPRSFETGSTRGVISG